MNQLRKELNQILGALPVRRPAVLRRSRREEWLYTTDLPLAADQEPVDLFLSLVREAGWHAEIYNGWLELDRQLIQPPNGWIPGKPGAETECCLSLLRRKHPKRKEPDPEDAEKAAARNIRRLIKAGESGNSEWEGACAAIHREWAVRLREGRDIPPVDTGFLIKEE